MARPFLTYASTVILQAVANGYRYGFDIIDMSGLPGGTVYPALRRLEEAGHLTSNWEKPGVARAEPRPPRKYYDITREGPAELADAVKRYRLLEQSPPIKLRSARPSRA
jgi:DNA-binding PadR family transcriptional regulator